MFGINNCDTEGLEDALAYYNLNSLLGFSQQYFDDPDDFEDDAGDN